MKKTALFSLIITISPALLASCELSDNKSSPSSIVNQYVTGDTRGWQLDETNTGLRGDTANLTALDTAGSDSNLARLEEWGTITVLANVTIENKIITKEMDTGADGITLRHCLIKPDTVGAGMPLVHGLNFTMEDCEIDGSLLEDSAHTAVSTTGIIRRCNIHGMSTGIYLVNMGAATTVCENNYVHDLRYTALHDPHMDGITIRQSTGTGGVVIADNRAICANQLHSTGAFFSQPSAGSIDNIRIEGNLFEGYGYSLSVNNQSTFKYGKNITVKNNRVNAYPGGAGFNIQVPVAEFSENYTYDSNAEDGRGTLATL